MSDPATGPVRYRVSYSDRVRTALRELITRAKARGLGHQFLAAAKELDHRLHVYPQFGQPLRDLKLLPAQLWVAVVPPLVVHYVIDEERRLVFVGAPIMHLPRSGL